MVMELKAAQKINGGAKRSEQKRTALYVFAIARWLLIVFVFAVTGGAQTLAGGAEQVERLRAQLREVEAKEAGTQERVRQYDSAIQPQAIANSLAGVGSLHPEVMRENRRRQLESEKTRLQEQLASLAAYKTRLEAAIVVAEAETARQSASAVTAAQSTTRATEVGVAPPAVISRSPSRRIMTRTRARKKVPKSRRAGG